jgi:quinol---cytochrome c reductase iron-sulfur subunit, bacillus type
VAEDPGQPGGNGADGAPEDAPGAYVGPRAVDPAGADEHDDPEYITRTRFLTNVALVTGGVATAAILVPVVGFAIAPTVQGEDFRWVDVGALKDFPSGQTSSLAVSGPDPEANRRIFLRNRDDQLIAIWNRCAHLGCPVAYSAGGDNYVCPCHGGAYNSLGLVVGGPPPRPLDRLAVKIVRGKRTVALGPGADPTTQPGASTKRAQPEDRVLLGKPYSINSKQQVYKLHGPGEPVTGVLSNLYPFH